jgi:hypothetical protein
MPKVTPVSPHLRAVIDDQDGLVTVDQLLANGFSPDAIQRRVGKGVWQRLLPGVILTVSGQPTRRQRLVGAFLWAGPTSAIDGPDACDWYGVRPSWFDLGTVHVVVGQGSSARTQSYVRVRRATAEVHIGGQTMVRYVDPGAALIVAARGARTERDAIAVLSRGLQLGMVSVDDLRAARENIGDKWCRRVDGALLAVGVGLRSAGEVDARDVVTGSLILPEPLWNQWLDLGDGGPLVCADALWKDAGMLHETNGRAYHAWGLSFDDMQARHDRLTAAGLIALHNSPTRLRRQPDAVRRELERCYLLYAGRGLPQGVRLVSPPAIAS